MISIAYTYFPPETLLFASQEKPSPKIQSNQYRQKFHCHSKSSKKKKLFQIYDKTIEITKECDNLI
jgi:hypothetical protein